MKIIILLLALSLSPTIWAGEETYGCKHTTLEATLNCLYSVYKSANIELQSVVASIKSKRADDELFISGFTKSQSDWEVGFKSSRSSVYDLWRYGSVKNIKWLACKIELTNQRTIFLNNNYGASAGGA